MESVLGWCNEDLELWGICVQWRFNYFKVRSQICPSIDNGW
jgi:hypothetical protein